MNGAVSYSHRFVEFIPDDLDDRVLYVSREFQTATHKCMCGCGNKIVTPLSASPAPKRWVMTLEGETASLSPSIGNWSYPCQSHYWLRNGRVDWSRRWTADEISTARSVEASSDRRCPTPNRIRLVNWGRRLWRRLGGRAGS